jgi:hypothetical protein
MWRNTAMPSSKRFNGERIVEWCLWGLVIASAWIIVIVCAAVLYKDFVK